jgi:hypothetical protein
MGLTIEGDRWCVALTDNRQPRSALSALAHALQARRPPVDYNVLLADGDGRKAGSPDLGAFCETHHRRSRPICFWPATAARCRPPTLFWSSRRPSISRSPCAVATRPTTPGQLGRCATANQPPCSLTHCTLVDAKGFLSGLHRRRCPLKLPGEDNGHRH